MLIQMTADRFGASGTLYTKGTQYDLAADLAFRFIGDGVAFDVGTARESQEGGQLVPVKFNKVTGVMEADGAPVSGAGNGGGLPADIAFSASVPFTQNAAMPDQYVSTVIAITALTTGAVNGAIVEVDLIADGTNAPTFTGFTEWDGNSGYVNTSGVRNCITFFRRKTKYYYTINQAQGAPAEPIAATALTLSGPSTGVTGSASSNFTVGTNGSLASSVSVTLSDGGAGGTFTPSSVTLSSGSNPTATFTYTAATNGAKTISISNASGLTNPSSITYTAGAVTVPGAPTIGTATGGNAQATVTFTAPSSNGGSAILDYTATSSPGGFTATGASSPLTVTGLTNGTAYTFTVTARNAVGSGSASSASNSVTPANTTVTYNFESDTNGSAAANTTSVSGTWTVNTPTISGATYGKSLKCSTGSGNNNSITFTNASAAFLGNNQRATWRRGVTTTAQSKDGVLLRAQSSATGGAYGQIQQGYWFYVNGSGGVLTIYKMASGGPTQIGQQTFTEAADQWFRAEVNGTTLTFDTSPDGSTWTNKVTVTGESTFSTAAAACQYANDSSSTNVTTVNIDSIVFEVR